MFRSESILNKHKNDCLIINGEQRVKLDKGFISFKNYSRQMKVAFKIYAAFECILKESKESGKTFDKNNSWNKKYQDHVPCGFDYKVVCIDDDY